MLKISFQIRNRPWIRELTIFSHTAKRLDNFREPLLVASLEVKKSLRGEGEYLTGIKKKKQPDGKPFAPLKTSTLEIRRKRGISRGASFILRETDKKLLNNIDVLRVEKRFAVIGMKDQEILAMIQQSDRIVKVFGKARAFAPARIFIGFSEQVIKKILGILHKHLI